MRVKIPHGSQALGGCRVTRKCSLRQFRVPNRGLRAKFPFQTENFLQCQRKIPISSTVCPMRVFHPQPDCLRLAFRFWLPSRWPSTSLAAPSKMIFQRSLAAPRWEANTRYALVPWRRLPCSLHPRPAVEATLTEGRAVGGTVRPVTSTRLGDSRGGWRRCVCAGDTADGTSLLLFSRVHQPSHLL